MKATFLKLALSCTAAAAITSAARSATIGESEAVAVADWWYTRELSQSINSIPASERAARLAARERRQVHHVLDRDIVRRAAGKPADVLAYIVTYEPSGYVVVSGDDAVQPVLAFNVAGSFQWDTPNKNYLSHFVGRSTVGRIKGARAKAKPAKGAGEHANWRQVRNKMTVTTAPEGLDLEASGATQTSAGGNGVFLKTATWNQRGPYNDLCVARCGGIEVPSGCTATAMAILMQYHQWPKTGNGSKSYSDEVTGRNFTHSVDFSQQTYDWAKLPTEDITGQNTEVAKLMYHCGVAVEMNYAPDGSGAWPSVGAFNNHFRYRDTIDNGLFRAPADHEADLIRSIRGGLPTVISTIDHTMVACGYRHFDGAFFFLNGGHGGGDDGWFSLGDIDDSDLGDDRTIDASYPYCTPANYIYLDSDSTSWFPTGALREPFKKLEEGVSRVPAEGVLMIKGTTYRTENGSTLKISKAMKIKSYMGVATIKP
jgi:hypothetical protein